MSRHRCAVGLMNSLCKDSCTMTGMQQVHNMCVLDLIPKNINSLLKYASHGCHGPLVTGQLGSGLLETEAQVNETKGNQ